MDNLKLFFGVALLGFSLILFVISAITYRRIGSRRLLLVSLAFAMFFVKGLLLTLGLFISDLSETFGQSALVTILDFAVMAFLYLSVVKK